MPMVSHALGARRLPSLECSLIALTLTACGGRAEGSGNPVVPVDEPSVAGTGGTQANPPSTGGTGTGGSSPRSSGGATSSGGSSGTGGSPITSEENSTEVIDHPDDSSELEFLGFGDTRLDCCVGNQALPSNSSSCLKRGSETFLGWTWTVTDPDALLSYPEATAEVQGDSCVEVQDYEVETFAVAPGIPLNFSVPISIPSDCNDSTAEILVSPKRGLCDLEGCPPLDQTLLRICIEP